VGGGPSPRLPELGPCHSVARTNRTTSSTEMTASATALPDGRWRALPGCGPSLTSMRQYYPTRRTHGARSRQDPSSSIRSCCGGSAAALARRVRLP
jgi:hypothetical protein